MTGILEQITENKKREVSIRKKERPVSEIKRSPLFKLDAISLRTALEKPFPSIIAEFKRRSPSKGIINNRSTVEEVTKGYESAGAAAVSVLTDYEYFGGTNSDLLNAAENLRIPVLRKDFIIDEYQVYEAKSIGASAILLIGSVLTKKQSASLTGLAGDLGLEILFEIHHLKDLDVMDPGINIIGVNNRNLDTFRVDRANSLDLLSSLPVSCVKVAESGFESPVEILTMFSKGFNAFLIGERFMRNDDPGMAAAEFISKLK